MLSLQAAWKPALLRLREVPVPRIGSHRGKSGPFRVCVLPLRYRGFANTPGSMD
jgi:hypothetical protein